MIENITVAIATYNGERYIEKQLESIFNQSKQVDRVVICDDESTDNTINIINRLINKGLPINLYKNQKKLGYGLNFMKCINLCNSNFIFLSDQDDIWFNNKVELMMSFIKKNPKNLCWMHDCVITNKNLDSLIPSKLENIKKFGFNENSFVMGACMVISKDTKKYIFPYPKDLSHFGHDDWISNVTRSTGNLKIYKECLMFYRRHESITSREEFNSIENHNKLLNRIIRLKTSEKGKHRNHNLKLKQLRWSILIHKNYLKSGYKILKSFCINTHEIAINISNKNFFNRLFIVCRLFVRGYYKNRSGFFSLLIDLFFPYF